MAEPHFMSWTVCLVIIYIVVSCGIESSALPARIKFSNAGVGGRTAKREGAPLNSLDNAKLEKPDTSRSVLANDLGHLPEHNAHQVRVTRGAIYGSKLAPSQKHIAQIPTTKTRQSAQFNSAPADSTDEDNLESLEANREAFLEILNDHAKHPIRRKQHRNHQGKIQLRYDFENKRYVMVEQQSDEFL